MTIHSIKEFEKGDAVFHRSNSRIKMIVIGKNEETIEVTCRWTDSEGRIHKEEFFAQELGKCAENTGIRIRSIERNNNRY
jgi:hypothetical protein